ncbi:MAG TPA: hypothetical protein VEX61_09055 [Burkholderiales bacterium]|nr:hypothetical protein [Burkholderiales bacterium]
MKTLIFTAGVVLALSGCASSGPQLAWGKPGVSKVDYGTDVGMCTGFAAGTNTDKGSNTAGGIDGKTIANTESPGLNPMPQPANGGTSAQTEHSQAPIPAGGTYSGMASADFAQRAATQQRTAEMAAARARAAAFKTCLVERGYQEFPLTADQRAHLATLTRGSNEYHEYLYKLGSDADIVGKQSRAPVK